MARRSRDLNESARQRKKKRRKRRHERKLKRGRRGQVVSAICLAIYRHVGVAVPAYGTSAQGARAYHAGPRWPRSHLSLCSGSREQNVVQRVAEHRARSATSEVLRTCCGTISDNRSIQRSRSEHHNPTQPQRSASSNHDEQELAMAGIGARTQVSGGSAQNCPMAAKARTVQEQNAFTPVVAGAKTSGYAGHLVGR